MTIQVARKAVDRFREDIIYAASLLQNNTDRFARVIAGDSRTYNEFKKLSGDLFSLTESIMSEDGS